MLKGGWWWKSCGRGLNGLYLNDPQDLTARQGMLLKLTGISRCRSVFHSSFHIFFSFFRHSVVQMERLGLHLKKSKYDDQTKGARNEHIKLFGRQYLHFHHFIHQSDSQHLQCRCFCHLFILHIFDPSICKKSLFCPKNCSMYFPLQFMQCSYCWRRFVLIFYHLVSCAWKFVLEHVSFISDDCGHKLRWIISVFNAQRALYFFIIIIFFFVKRGTMLVHSIQILRILFD